MKVHAIMTGTVAVKTRQVEGVGQGLRRRSNMVIDREWSEPLPIYCFAIEHPEGVIVIDTGETARTSDPGYFQRWHPYLRFGVREWVKPEQEIGPQLHELGIEPADVRWVVLTHLHTDHAGGLAHFPDNQVLVSRRELAIASGRRGQLGGYPNHRWPTSFDPTVLDLEPDPFGPFPRSHRLTKAGDVTIVPLPGHTPGQIGVILEDGDHSLLFAGDSSYRQDLMLRGIVDGVSPNDAVAQLTHQRIRASAAETPTVYLVAHDPETAVRLDQRRTIGTEQLEAVTA
jgi:N-acyl homoserine lactone hydrolase